MSDQLKHPAIVRTTQTCEGSPDQWNGMLDDGQFFYFRLRWGKATLAVGPSPSTVEGITTTEQATAFGCRVEMMLYGDRLTGCFKTDQDRADTFDTLLVTLLAGRPTNDELAGYGRNGPVATE